MKKLTYLIVLVLILGLTLTGCLLSNVGQVPATEQSGITYLTKGGPSEITLYAGQDIPVGTVTVSDNGINLYVEYLTTGGWEMTETHLYVGKTNPTLLTSAPGQFPYSEPLDTPTSHTYTIPLEDIDSYSLIKGKKWVADIDLSVVPGDQIYIAAHAAVEKVIEPAPRYPSGVFDSQQELRKDGTLVRTERSDPEQGLEYETGRDEGNFFSLGFGGWIIVEFDCPIPNGEGDDLRIIEDTWGSYPLETAEVSASQDGITWVVLGTADNHTSIVGIHTISTFDLGSLEWAKYIKVIDTTDPDLHGSTADGFDLNAVEALQDCIQEETAWGDGEPIRPDKNWAMYFTYTIEEIFIETVTVSPDGEDDCSVAILGIGKKYRLEVSGTYTYWLAQLPGAGIADAEYSLRPAGSYNPSPDPQWISGDVFPAPDTNYLELWVNGSSQDWIGDYISHIYSMEYDGDGSTVCFSILDSHYGDNSGSLTVDIYWIP